MARKRNLKSNHSGARVVERLERRLLLSASLAIKETPANPFSRISLASDEILGEPAIAVDPNDTNLKKRFVIADILKDGSTGYGFVAAYTTDGTNWYPSQDGGND